VIAIDTSAIVAYLAGEAGADIEAIDHALSHKAAVLPPPVLAELLSAPNLTDDVREMLVSLPMLEVGEGYWERAGLLRAQIARRGFKARLADALIAQSCLDHDLTLITRDRDVRHFSRSAGLRVAPPER
jgi:predicted nucleic acid-binding protein